MGVAAIEIDSIPGSATGFGFGYRNDLLLVAHPTIYSPGVAPSRFIMSIIPANARRSAAEIDAVAAVAIACSRGDRAVVAVGEIDGPIIPQKSAPTKIKFNV